MLYRNYITLTGLTILMTFCWIMEGQSTIKFDLIVAQNGTGDYNTISDAILATPISSRRRYYIKIKAGKYIEYVTIKPEHTNLTLIGDGIDKTIITGNKSFGGDHVKTLKTATVGIYVARFVAIGIKFENTAGPHNGQAVALMSEQNYAFYRCSFVEYQDTLYARNKKQFYRECDIYGTVDFIFRDATVVFHNCNVYACFYGIGSTDTITAQGRTDPIGIGGTILYNCTTTTTEDLRQNKLSVKVYLGQPWKNYSRTIIMKTFIDDIIDPKGWYEWKGQRVDTIYYGEYANRGPGAPPARRVQWKGYKILNRLEAQKFTVKTFISGYEWIPSIGIPFTPDLL